MPKQDNIATAEAINLAEIAAHPAEALKALIQVVQIQGDLIKKLQDRQDSDYEHFSQDILDDRRRLKKLEVREPQPAQKDHGIILKALLADHGGKMLAKEARQIMRMTPSRFSELLKVTDDIEVKDFSLDKRKQILGLK